MALDGADPKNREAELEDFGAQKNRLLEALGEALGPDEIGERDESGEREGEKEGGPIAARGGAGGILWHIVGRLLGVVVGVFWRLLVWCSGDS